MHSKANDLNRLAKLLESSLIRFVDSGSIQLVEYVPPSVEKQGKGKSALSLLNFELPKASVAKAIRSSWKSDRRNLPRAGCVFPDGSILTIQFMCKSLPLPLQLQTLADKVQIRGLDDQPIGYIAMYSYSFYPNSKSAEQIGFFRYDYHFESMGDGDLGGHHYFHFHRAEEGFRHVTGPVFEFDKIVSGIERVLAPEQRAKRFEKWFFEGRFDELLMDLTVDGIVKLQSKLQADRSLSSFKHQKKFEEFVDENV